MEWSKAGACCTMRQRTDEVEGPVVELAGEVDVTSTLDLERTLRTALEEHGRLTADLSGLSFIDSSGVRVLTEVGAFATQRGWAFLIRGATGDVARVLRLASLIAPVLRWGQRPQ